MVLAITGAGCGTGSTPPTDLPSPPPSAGSLPPLQGSYRAPEGALLTITGPGTFRGPGGSGTFTVSGVRITLIRDDGKPIDGHRPDADRLVLSVPGTAPVTMFRVGSAAAQTPEALTPPVAAAPHLPSPDPNVPLDRYTTVTDPDVLQEIGVAFSKDPLGEKAVAALLPDPPTTDDAFARRERVQRDGAAIVERLKAHAAQRYCKLTASTVPEDLPRTAADLSRAPRFVRNVSPANGAVLLETYDFERKGFPIRCLGKGSISLKAIPLMDFVAGGSQRRGSSLQAVLTHADVKLLHGAALDGSNVLASISVPL